jgi:hypothetical protein
MPSPTVLNESIRLLEKSILSWAALFLDLEAKAKNCRQAGCAWCRQIHNEKEKHQERVRLLRKYICSLTPRDTPSFFFDVSSWKGHGKWQGFIADDGYYVHGKDGDAGFFGHNWLHEEYEAVCGKERRNALIKVHSQAISCIIFFGDKPLPTTRQLETIRDILLSSDEPVGIYFQYGIQHFDPSLPF